MYSLNELRKQSFNSLADVKKACKPLILKTHPDKGGNAMDFTEVKRFLEEAVFHFTYYSHQTFHPHQARNKYERLLNEHGLSFSDYQDRCPLRDFESAERHKGDPQTVPVFMSPNYLRDFSVSLWTMCFSRHGTCSDAMVLGLAFAINCVLSFQAYFTLWNTVGTVERVTCQQMKQQWKQQVDVFVDNMDEIADGTYVQGSCIPDFVLDDPKFDNQELDCMPLFKSYSEFDSCKFGEFKLRSARGTDEDLSKVDAEQRLSTSRRIIAEEIDMLCFDADKGSSEQLRDIQNGLEALKNCEAGSSVTVVEEKEESLELLKKALTDAYHFFDKLDVSKTGLFNLRSAVVAAYEMELMKIIDDEDDITDDDIVDMEKKTQQFVKQKVKIFPEKMKEGSKVYVPYTDLVKFLVRQKELDCITTIIVELASREIAPSPQRVAALMLHLDSIAKGQLNRNVAYHLLGLCDKRSQQAYLKGLDQVKNKRKKCASILHENTKRQRVCNKNLMLGKEVCYYHNRRKLLKK